MEALKKNKWSTEKLRENADKWSLEGDVALLNIIKEFSQVIIYQIIYTYLKRNIGDMKFYFSNF